MVSAGRLADSALGRDEVNKRERVARYRHRKRGTTYQLIGHAEVQAPDDAPLIEGEMVTVYRCEQDGALWVRRKPEFEDGRFERLSDTALAEEEPSEAEVEAAYGAFRVETGDLTEGLTAALRAARKARMG